MSEEDPAGHVKHLIRLRQELADDFESQSLYEAHVKKLEYVRDEKHRKMDEWLENEQKSAQRYHHGQYYVIDNDHEERIDRFQDRVNNFLAFKIGLLRQKFPEAAAYFESRGYVWPVEERRAVRPRHLTPNVDIALSNEPLIPRDEVMNDVRKVTRVASGMYDVWALLNGANTGDLAVLELPNLPPVEGMIGKVTKDYAEFKQHGARTMNISFRALELQHAKLRRA